MQNPMRDMSLPLRSKSGANNADAAMHLHSQHSCELCENKRADWLWQLQIGSETGMVALCDPCRLKAESKGYLEYKGVKILVLNDETPPGVQDIVEQEYSPTAAKWVRGRRPEDGQ